MPERTDIELFLEFKEQGNFRALEELIDRYKKAVVNFFYHLSSNEATSDDLAQEVFIKLARSVRGYKPQAKFTTFLFRIAHTTWLDYGRLNAVKYRRVSLEAVIGWDREDTLKEMIDSGAPRPVDELIGSETEIILKRALKDVPEEQRQVIELFLFGHLNCQDISDVLEIPYGTVRTRIKLAIERLKELLKK